jgi:hypothetical protein
MSPRGFHYAAVGPPEGPMPAPSITSAAMTIEVDGGPHPMLVAGLLAARMACGLDHAAEALLVLDLPTPLDGDAAAAMFEAVRLGRTLQFGVGETAPALFSGEIVAVTQDLRADLPPRLEIVAQDQLAALGRTTVSCAYHDQTPLDALRAVAARHQLALTGEIGDGGRRQAIVQAGESDLAFVRRLALELDVGIVADEAGNLRPVRRRAGSCSARRCWRYASWRTPPCCRKRSPCRAGIQGPSSRSPRCRSCRTLAHRHLGARSIWPIRRWRRRRRSPPGCGRSLRAPPGGR